MLYAPGLVLSGRRLALGPAGEEYRVGPLPLRPGSAPCVLQCCGGRGGGGGPTAPVGRPAPSREFCASLVASSRESVQTQSGSSTGRGGPLPLTCAGCPGASSSSSPGGALGPILALALPGSPQLSVVASPGDSAPVWCLWGVLLPPEPCHTKPLWWVSAESLPGTSVRACLLPASLSVRPAGRLAHPVPGCLDAGALAAVWGRQEARGLGGRADWVLSPLVAPLVDSGPGTPSVLSCTLWCRPTGTAHPAHLASRPHSGPAEGEACPAWALGLGGRQDLLPGPCRPTPGPAVWTQ